MRRGGGKIIGKPISGSTEKDDEYIEIGTEDSFFTEDTRSGNRRSH